MIEKIKDDLYIQKGLFGWKIIYPIFKDKDKGWKLDNINWKNFLIGSWSNILTVFFVVLLIIGLTLSYIHDTELCREIVENPCMYSYVITGVDKPYNINYTEILSNLKWGGNNEGILYNGS